MTDREKLIEEAAERAYPDTEWSQTATLIAFRDAFARGWRESEKAHTPTDDEREAPKQEICERCGWAISAHARSQYGLDCPLGGVRPGFRRSEVPEPRFSYASEWEQPETIIERVLDDAGYDLFQTWRTGVVNAIAAWVNEAGRAVEPQGEPSDAMVEAGAREAFFTDDAGGHIRGGFTWETIPEVGRENYRKMVRGVLHAALAAAGGAR